MLTLCAGLFMGGCSREDMPGGVSGDGNRVVFTLEGITPKGESKATRATGDNDQSTTNAATDAEKKVSKLLAVTYERQSSGDMGLYKVFDVAVTDDGCSFDIAKDGAYDMYLVANAHNEDTPDADANLYNKIMTLEPGSAVSALEALIVTQAPDAADNFVMTTPEPVKVVSYSGETADCGSITLRRLSVRIDIINKADGLTVKDVTFVNRPVKSQLFTPNEAIAEKGAYEDKNYDIVDLVGSMTVPTKCESQIYGYENLSRAGESTVPSLVINYSFEDQDYSHVVEFIDAKDPSGMTPLALKRNYLYRVNIGRKLEPEFNIEVLDWTNDETFTVDDVPFQAEMNAALAVTNFASSNVASLNEAEHTVAFTTTDHNNTSAYLPWSAGWATAVYYNETDATYYRVPTKDELYLLFPDEKDPISFTTAADGSKAVTETLPANLFGSVETNGGEGTSYYKSVESSVNKGDVVIKCPVVYAIRFKGTAQYAAYRYEIKDWDNPDTGELEIRIKALQEGSLWSIDDIATEEYWGNPSEGDTDKDNQLIYNIWSTGYKATSDGELIGEGTNSFLWTSTEVDGYTAYDAGHNIGASLVDKQNKLQAATLRLVKATDAEIQTALNSYLKVNMFTRHAAKNISFEEKQITEFLDDSALEGVLDIPEESYYSFDELQASELTANGVVFKGPEGDNNKYRLPTLGEIGLLMPRASSVVEDGAVIRRSPFWNDNPATNTTGDKMYEGPFTETFYYTNDEFNHENVSDVDNSLIGESELKVGTLRETITFKDGDHNIHPVYGLRFKGTDEYAAYRWELCSISSEEPLKLYLSIKIKAMKKNDTKTSIDDVVNDAEFWTEGSYIEFKIPAAGYYSAPASNARKGYFGYLASSTLSENGELFRLGFIHRCADIVTMGSANSLLWHFIKAE